MKLVSAMDIKEFAEKYHENFATREEEEKAAIVLAKSDAQIELQNLLKLCTQLARVLLTNNSQ